jgi:hypothetical protein
MWQFHINGFVEITVVEKFLQRVEGLLYLNNIYKAMSEHFVVQISIMCEYGIKR